MVLNLYYTRRPGARAKFLLARLPGQALLDTLANVLGLPYDTTDGLVGVAGKAAAHTLYTLHALLYDLSCGATQLVGRLARRHKKMLDRAP